MLFLLLSCFSFSFFLISKSMYKKPIKQWKRDTMLNFSGFLVSFLHKSSYFISLVQSSFIMSFKKLTLGSKPENVAENEEISLLDLPELTLELILERLSPNGLCSMAEVCSSLRDRCRSDRLWEKHMKQKWGKLIGDAAFKEWKLYLALRKNTHILDQNARKGLFEFFLNIWPISRIARDSKNGVESKSFLPIDSIMGCYLSLEGGKFQFPAQVYNRENGHVGFMLSCYDAKVSYDSVTDTFQARYSPYGRQTTEEKIKWDRLRAPPTDTPPNFLHVSDCLNDLKPGDHMEIQWRRNKEFPYGWWYGVVGHLESCDGNEYHCHCHNSDCVILEFSQYMPGSQWRQTSINRKDHREEGNEVDGFYGGIRKLYDKEEISTWNRLRPNIQ